MYKELIVSAKFLNDNDSKVLSHFTDMLSLYYKENGIKTSNSLSLTNYLPQYLAFTSWIKIQDRFIKCYPKSLATGGRVHMVVADSVDHIELNCKYDIIIGIGGADTICSGKVLLVKQIKLDKEAECLVSELVKEKHPYDIKLAPALIDTTHQDSNVLTYGSGNVSLDVREKQKLTK